jgi:hypothetical protein
MKLSSLCKEVRDEFDEKPFAGLSNSARGKLQYAVLRWRINKHFRGKLSAIPLPPGQRPLNQMFRSRVYIGWSPTRIFVSD